MKHTVVTFIFIVVIVIVDINVVVVFSVAYIVKSRITTRVRRNANDSIKARQIQRYKN